MSVLGFKRLKASHAAILTWTSRQNAGIRIQHIKLNRSAQILHWTFKTVHMPPSLMFNPPLCLHSTFTRRTNGHCLRVFTAANSYPPSLMYPLHTPSNSASFFFSSRFSKRVQTFVTDVSWEVTEGVGVWGGFFHSSEHAASSPK